MDIRKTCELAQQQSQFFSLPLTPRIFVVRAPWLTDRPPWIGSNNSTIPPVHTVHWFALLLAFVSHFQRLDHKCYRPASCGARRVVSDAVTVANSRYRQARSWADNRDKHNNLCSSIDSYDMGHNTSTRKYSQLPRLPRCLIQPATNVTGHRDDTIVARQRQTTSQSLAGRLIRHSDRWR